MYLHIYVFVCSYVYIVSCSVSILESLSQSLDGIDSTLYAIECQYGHDNSEIEQGKLLLQKLQNLNKQLNNNIYISNSNNNCISNNKLINV